MIKAEELSRKYGNFVAVNGVSFEIPKGEIVGLLGHNGAGKTTIMKMITGYLEPSSGEVLVDGLPVMKNRLKVQEKLGYLPESSPLYPELTVVEYLDYVCDLRGVASRNRGKIIREVIGKTGLEAKALELVSTLSKGLKQRVGLAQAIIHKPEVLILDEPTSGLDPSQIEEVRNLIKELSGETTIILSTHILQEVEAVCDRVIIIRQGELAADALLSELKQSGRLAVEIGDENDRSEELLSSLDVVDSVSKSVVTGGVRYLLKLTQPSEVAAPMIAEKIVSEGRKLTALERERRDLETIFREVNRR